MAGGLHPAHASRDDGRNADGNERRRRNRIKRIARESFREIRAELPAIDILLIARESADAHDNATLRADLKTLWRRLAATTRD